MKIRAGALSHYFWNSLVAPELPWPACWESALEGAVCLPLRCGLSATRKPSAGTGRRGWRYLSSQAPGTGRALTDPGHRLRP